MIVMDERVRPSARDRVAEKIRRNTIDTGVRVHEQVLRDSEKRVVRAAAYRGPKSRCVCGHVGDGPDSQHEEGIVLSGHGRCFFPHCGCRRFSFYKALPMFEEYMIAGEISKPGRKPRKARQLARLR